MSNEALEELGDYASSAMPEAIIGFEIKFGELTVEATAHKIVDLIRFLRDDTRCQFISLIDICGVDWPGRAQRFDVVYHLLSPRQNLRTRIKIKADEVKPVASIGEIFPAADWFEREAYDLYGIIFSGHSDLRRILTDYGFDGHPLRKDFPVTGFVETRYDDDKKRVVYEPVRLAQELRNFDFQSPWEAVEYMLPGDEKAN